MDPPEIDTFIHPIRRQSIGPLALVGERTQYKSNARSCEQMDEAGLVIGIRTHKTTR